MTKSSMVRRGFLPLILIAAPGALAAQRPTPEEAVEAQRAEIRELVSQACPETSATGDPNDVLVCGRREERSRYRVPAPELVEGSRRRETAGGEQLAAMNAGSTTCSTVGPMPTGCTRGLDLMAIGATALRLVRQALANRD